MFLPLKSMEVGLFNDRFIFVNDMTPGFKPFTYSNNVITRDDVVSQRLGFGRWNFSLVSQIGMFF